MTAGLRGLRAGAVAGIVAFGISLTLVGSASAQTATTGAILPPVVAPGVAAAQPSFAEPQTPGVLSASPQSAGDPPVAAIQPPAVAPSVAPGVAAVTPAGPFATVAAAVPAGMPRAGSGPLPTASGLSGLVLAGLAAFGLGGALVERRRAGRHA